MLSDDDSIDRELVLVRREQELLRTRRARCQSRASASDGPAAVARHRHYMSGQATSPESLGVHQRLVYESVRSKRTNDRNVSHDLLGELEPDTATIEPLLSTLPYQLLLPQLTVPGREHNSSASSRHSDCDSSDSAAQPSDAFKAEPGKRLGADYLFPASSRPLVRAAPPKFGVRRHRVKVLIHEQPLLTATENACRPQVLDILARPVMVNRAADQMLHVSNANHNQHFSSPVCVIRRTANVAVNTLSNYLPVVVDNSSNLAVAKDVHNFVESKVLANVGVNVSTSNVCEKSIDVVSHSSDKLVQSVTVKSEPKTCDNVCPPKDVVVKSGEDVKHTAASEENKPATLCGKEPRKKGHRARSLAPTLRGINSRHVLSFVCQNMMACLYRL